MSDTTPNAKPAAASADTTLTLSPSDIYAEMRRRDAEERAAEREDLATLRPALLALARTAGAIRIAASYEGGGDSGVVDSLFAEPEAADTALKAVTILRPHSRWNPSMPGYETVEARTPFFDAVRDMLTMMLTHAVGNWWDGDIETSGEIDWRIDADKIDGEHNEIKREGQYTSRGDTFDDESCETSETTTDPVGGHDAASSEG